MSKEKIGTVHKKTYYDVEFDTGEVVTLSKNQIEQWKLKNGDKIKGSIEEDWEADTDEHGNYCRSWSVVQSVDIKEKL